jgi:hypothetical protein
MSAGIISAHRETSQDPRNRLVRQLLADWPSDWASRSCGAAEMYDWSDSVACAGGSSCQSSSTNRSNATGLLTCRASRATLPAACGSSRSRAVCLGGDRSRSAPSHRSSTRGACSRESAKACKPSPDVSGSCKPRLQDLSVLKIASS